MIRGLAVLVSLAAAGCHPTVPFRLEAARGIVGRPSHFRLVAAPGARINARLKPALELNDGTVLRFDSPHLSPDSAYFTDPPTTEAALPEEARRGVVRASVCPDDEQVCRSYEVAVRW